jgi:Rps23 Pro-64 3,4-dihydroxylase Tpa1-like proline 4-hydroxylase
VNALPYPHCVISQLCEPNGMRAIRSEVIGNLQATFKESDIFKVYQTTDLANLTAAQAEILPNLLSLRAALYGEEFRAFVSSITGATGLTDKIDCSCNAYVKGGHLLCHDDVIGGIPISGRNVAQLRA